MTTSSSNTNEEDLEQASYLGNSNLKPAGFKFEWTQKMIDEYVRCSEDVVYFTETYMKIVNVDDGLVSFKLYDYQKEMLHNMQHERFNIITCARQSGKSITTCAYILWYIIFHENKKVGLLANKGDTAKEILGRIRLAYQHLPKWLQQGMKDFNKTTITLENGSMVMSAATSSDNVRGHSFNLIFIDEAAFVENWEAFFASVFPTISSGKTTKLILVSTPNGMNHFAYIWQLAVEGKNNYKAQKVTWDMVPGRDEEWKRTMLAGMNFDVQKFAQEQNVEFHGSSGALIAGWKLQQLMTDLQVPIAESGGHLYLYDSPVKGRRYIMACDVSRGKGLDYSTFSVIDVTELPFRQSAVFRDNLCSPIEFAQTIFQTAKAFNNAYVIIELNDIGAQVADVLRYDPYNYEYILYTESNGRNGKRLGMGYGKNQDQGIRTTKTTKALGCALLKLLLEQNQLLVWDRWTVEELACFSRKNNSYEAEPGKHDDLAMTLVIFAWMTDDDFFKEFTTIQTVQSLRERTDEDLATELRPIGLYSENVSDELLGMTPEQVADMNWLLGDCVPKKPSAENEELNNTFFFPC